MGKAPAVRLRVPGGEFGCRFGSRTIRFAAVVGNAIAVLGVRSIVPCKRKRRR